MSTMSDQFFAHSASEKHGAQPMHEHLQQVANLAATFAHPFGAEEEARLAGYLHDLGKYSDLFQARLQGKARGVDHWSPGAWLAFAEYRAAAAGMAIWGHHIGLKQLYSEAIHKNLNPERLKERLDQLERKIPDLENSYAELKRRLLADGITLPKSDKPHLDPAAAPIAKMLDVRMLFSTLVDADFLDTAKHFGEVRPTPPDLQPKRALRILAKHVRKLQQSVEASEEVLQMRRMLWEACLNAADESPGLFTLTAPTGAGKTLSMLGFALKHATKHGLRRIVVVIPYLSIIEQTAQVYRELLEPHFGTGYLIEHHSLTGTRPQEASSDHQGPNDKERIERLLSENWDAPLIVTTSVQLLESLFADHPSACRKLHRLARSVILFDEVQTLPTRLVVPTLQTLSRLASRYGSTVVFSTATQPAFDHLHEHVNVPGTIGWQPKEIVPDTKRLFALSRRVRVDAEERRWSWEQLAEEMLKHDQALCVLNIKRHAKELAQLLVERAWRDAVFHLSTSMCPAHRMQVLETVRARLREGQPCYLVSTQCVEAGVDVDFPIVFRALAPLDSIAQAAGRCNRNGKRQEGVVVLFEPECEGKKYPTGAYEQAADITRSHMRRHSHGIDLYDPDLYDRYYRDLYDLTKPESRSPELNDAITRCDFEDVAKVYRVIPDAQINVLVPYDLEKYDQLANEARGHGLTASWIRRARPYVVSVYRPRPSDPIWSFLEPVPVKNGKSEEWTIYTEPSHYDPLLGLQPQQAPEIWIL